MKKSKKTKVFFSFGNKRIKTDTIEIIPKFKEDINIKKQAETFYKKLGYGSPYETEKKYPFSHPWEGGTSLILRTKKVVVLTEGDKYHVFSFYPSKDVEYFYGYKRGKKPKGYRRKYVYYSLNQGKKKLEQLKRKKGVKIHDVSWEGGDESEEKWY